MSKTTKEQNERLLQLVREAVQHDNAMREQYSIGDKFRFIRDRLRALLTRVEESAVAFEKDNEQKKSLIGEDETLVYVYLYNAQGMLFQTWQKMLIPSVFYEYSVNRPIYADKNHVEVYVRNKTNKAQHGYLTVVVRKQDILPANAESGPTKDTYDNPIVKVKEGSLRFEKLVSFTHNLSEFTVIETGEVVKKE